MTSEQENYDECINTFLAYKIKYETDNAMAGYIEQVCVESDPDLIKYKFNANKIAAALKKDMPVRVIKDERGFFCCSNCMCRFSYKLKSPWFRYCYRCGQKLDWETADNEESKI